ncbi:MAG: lysophospholipid acyltransferase family protein, partial [Candidatus Omnitrophota bacterium]
SATGRAYIPKKGGFILASNHTSYLDPMVLAVACFRRLNFMARHDLFNNPLFAWFIRQLGAFPVKRKTADFSAFKEAIRRLRRGEPLVIFPEGTRQSAGILGDPEEGVGLLAAKLNVPIVPVFIRGAERVWPKNARALNASKISVYFGKQIFVERRTPSQQTAQMVMESIRRLSWSVSQ